LSGAEAFCANSKALSPWEETICKKEKNSYCKAEDQYCCRDGHMTHANVKNNPDPYPALAVFFLSLDAVNNKKDYRGKEENYTKPYYRISENLILECCIY
jgi:hypothetical protein